MTNTCRERGTRGLTKKKSACHSPSMQVENFVHWIFFQSSSLKIYNRWGLDKRFNSYPATAFQSEVPACWLRGGRSLYCWPSCVLCDKWTPNGKDICGWEHTLNFVFLSFSGMYHLAEMCWEDVQNCRCEHLTSIHLVNLFYVFSGK